MTIESVYMISQIFASVVVALTLVAVVFSLRQNTRAQKTLSVQSITAAIAAINVPAMESPALGQALAAATRNWPAATREERILSHYFLFTLFKLLEQAWYQNRTGGLDEGVWAGWETSLLRFYWSPGVQTGWWPSRRWAYSPAFQQFLEASHPPSMTAASSIYEIFEGAVATEPQASAP